MCTGILVEGGANACGPPVAELLADALAELLGVLGQIATEPRGQRADALGVGDGAAANEFFVLLGHARDVVDLFEELGEDQSAVGVTRVLLEAASHGRDRLVDAPSSPG